MVKILIENASSWQIFLQLFLKCYLLLFLVFSHFAEMFQSLLLLNMVNVPFCHLIKFKHKNWYLLYNVECIQTKKHIEKFLNCKTKVKLCNSLFKLYYFARVYKLFIHCVDQSHRLDEWTVDPISLCEMPHITCRSFDTVYVLMSMF